MDRVSAKGPLKNIIDGCWPGRHSQRDLKKRAGEPRGKNQNGLGVGEGAVQKYDRPMLAGRPSQGDQNRRPGEPKGENQNGLSVGEEAIEKHDRRMLAGKAKPRGCEKKASKPKGNKSSS